jgi:hypothetical protein
MHISTLWFVKKVQTIFSKFSAFSIGDTLSDVHSQENGIVQGAILSVNLFLIALRSITSCSEDPSMKIIGYADDWTIYLAHANMAVIQTKLQDTVDNLTILNQSTVIRFSDSYLRKGWTG